MDTVIDKVREKLELELEKTSGDGATDALLRVLAHVEEIKKEQGATWRTWTENQWQEHKRYSYEDCWSGESWAKAFSIIGSRSQKGQISVTAAHDQIWLGAKKGDPSLTDEEAIELYRLGFHYTSECWTRYV